MNINKTALKIPSHGQLTTVGDEQIITITIESDATSEVDTLHIAEIRNFDTPPLQVSRVKEKPVSLSPTRNTPFSEEALILL